jgi:O-antigen/teichoic acid export membrane protein
LRRFGIIARTRVVQAVTGVVTMLGLGWLGLAPIGLLLGNMLTLGSGGVSLAAQALRHDRTRLQAISPAAMRQTLSKYRRYPVFSTPEALANVAGMQVPVLMIASVSGPEAGQLFLAMQVMAAPLALIGAAVGQVYASRASEELRNGTLHRFTLTMMKRLFLIGIVPITLAAALSPFLFTLVFGAEWQRAGVIVAWIAPWMLAQLVVSPVSIALHATGNQAVALTLQVSGLILRVGAVAVLPSVLDIGLSESYALSGVMFYGLYGMTILRVLRNR